MFEHVAFVINLSVFYEVIFEERLLFARVIISSQCSLTNLCLIISIYNVFKIFY